MKHIATFFIICLTALQAPNALANIPNDVSIKDSAFAREKVKSLEILQLLLQEDFETLETTLKSEIAKGPIKQTQTNRLTFHVTYWWDIENGTDVLMPLISKWLEKKPDSPLAQTVKGLSHYERVYEIRGTGWGNTVSQQQNAAMLEELKLAKNTFDKAIEIDPQIPSLWEGAIKSMTFYNQYDRRYSRYYFQQALKHVPFNYGVHKAYHRSISERWGGSIDEVLTYINAIPLAHLNNPSEPEPDNPAIYFIGVEAQIDFAGYEDHILNQIEKTYSDETMKKLFARLVFGGMEETKYYQKAWKEIDHISKTVLEKDPDFIYAAAKYAAIAAKIGKNDIAKKYYKYVLEKDPALHAYYAMRLATIYQEEKKYKDALKYYRLATKYFPEDRIARAKTGYLLTLVNQWEESALIYADLAKEYPDSIYWSNLCASVARMKNYRVAHKSCDRSIKTNPNHPWAYHLKGWIYRWEGKEDLAVQYINKAKNLGWQGY